MLLLFSASCSDSTDPETSAAIATYITGVMTANGSVTAQLRTGTPTPGSGPIVNATGTSALIEGGSAIRTLTATTAFNRVLIAVAGVDGYYELALPSSVTTTDVILTLAQTPPASFTLQYGAGTGTSFGAFDTEVVSVVNVGTGAVQVSVAWNTASDVDLHLVQPNGEEIYYGDDVSTSGGTLDLDSNAGCSIDGKQQENITWPTGSPPRGTYTVRVDYWDSCAVTGSTNYVVTVRVQGQAVKTYTGTFTGGGDQGGAGAGATVTTFTY
jgi:hypothetical protein